MAKGHHPPGGPGIPGLPGLDPAALPPGVKVVPSIFDAIEDGNEYGSIVSVLPGAPDLMPDVQRALAGIELVRGRPCLCYAANVVRDGTGDTAIGPSDHLPFNEMVDRVPATKREIDILLATPGGLVDQVNLFVEALRPRFDVVEFLVPYVAMSAGTLWALSGDRIWMDSRSFLGPIDPQVQGRDGSLLPAQALLTLLDKIQKDGEVGLAKGQQPKWTDVVLLQHLDHRQLGAAITASTYVATLAASYLEKFKFKTWTTHRTHNPGAPVTPEERKARAEVVAGQLCSHDKWKAHGHKISRNVLESERILIERVESVPGLQKALRKAWAMLYYIFDKAPVSKLIISANYRYARSSAPPARVP